MKSITEAPAVLILYRELHAWALVVAWWHSLVAGLVITLESSSQEPGALDLILMLPDFLSFSASWHKSINVG